MYRRTVSFLIGGSIVFLLIVAMRTSDAAAPASQPADDAAATALQLLPSAAAPDEATVKSLLDGTWELRGRINILGEGNVETLRFATSSDGSLQLTQTHHRNLSFNAPDKVIPDQTETRPCNITGVVLQHGQERQSFVVLKGEALVLNALVPLGKGKWYYTSRLPGNPPGAQEEYLFEFGDDPCKVDHGTATVQIRQNNFPAKKFAVHFALTLAGADCRYFDVLDDDAKRCLARIGIRTDGTYGLMTDNRNLNTKVFLAVAAKQAKPATQGAEPTAR